MGVSTIPEVTPLVPSKKRGTPWIGVDQIKMVSNLLSTEKSTEFDPVKGGSPRTSPPEKARNQDYVRHSRKGVITGQGKKRRQRPKAEC